MAPAPLGVKCLALACSPRRDGNTTTLARLALEGCDEAGGETELLYLTDYKMEPCLACGACNETGRCIINDDAAFIFDKINTAHRFILAAPIYSMGLNAQTKALVDRAQQFWAAKYLLKQKKVVPPGQPAARGIFISCAGTRLPGVFDGAIRVVQYFFKMLDLELQASLCYPGVDHQGEILRHPKALAEVKAQGHLLGAV